MMPAALELLMRRLQVHDRKRVTPGAMVAAELWNIAVAQSSDENRQKHPEHFSASDFLPELPEERARREREEARAKLPPTKEEFEAYKKRLLAGVPRKN
jgi:hypothetical protein